MIALARFPDRILWSMSAPEARVEHENLTNPTQRLRDPPRCSATARSIGQYCQCPSKQGWNVCRLQGAGGGASLGKAHPNDKHGLRTKEMEEMRRLVSFLGKEVGETG